MASNPTSSQAKRPHHPHTQHQHQPIPTSPGQVAELQPHFNSNPYQQPYSISPSNFGNVYQQQPSYLSQHGSLGQTIHQPLPHYSSQPVSSPGNPRKRRASELDDGGMHPTTMSPYPGPQSSMMPPQHPNATFGMSQPPPPPHGMKLENSVGPQQGPEVVQHAAKKGRTNTPWTPAEEQKLKQMREAGNSWSEIAKAFPQRTEGSVKKHWYKDMHYAEFGDNEGSFKQTLQAAIKEYEASKWKVIGQKVGKPAKACEQYAKEHLSGKT